MKRRLTLVGPGDALTGMAPTGFERASKTCRPGDPMHQGLVRIAASLARHALRRTVAPSARGSLVAGLDALEPWARGELDVRQLGKLRSDCFQAVPAIERATLEAMRQSLATSHPRSDTVLDEHAERVVWRYIRLAVRLAADAAVLTLDGVASAPILASVVQQVAAARAYQAVGLGAARQAELRERAVEQAAFEVRGLGVEAHSEAALALQVWHEYLGVRWKVLHDAERAYIDRFVDWAFSGSEY
jgi:hypothetical protein